MAVKKGRHAPDLSFALSYDTVCALQAILTQQSIHVQNETSVSLMKEFDQINRFYEHLTDYVERHS